MIVHCDSYICVGFCQNAKFCVQRKNYLMCNTFAYNLVDDGQNLLQIFTPTTMLQISRRVMLLEGSLSGVRLLSRLLPLNEHSHWAIKKTSL